MRLHLQGKVIFLNDFFGDFFMVQNGIIWLNETEYMIQTEIFLCPFASLLKFPST